MTPPAEFVLESNRSRAVGDVDVSSGRDTDANVSLQPDSATVTVGGGSPANGGTVTVRDPSDTEDVGVLTGANGSGRLELSDSDGDSIVTLDADRGTQTTVEVSNGDNPTARLDNVTAGGRLRIYDPYRSEPVVVAETTVNGGKLSLRDDTDRTTCELFGRDGALLLSGTPEVNTENDFSNEAPLYGGGEFVIQDWAKSDNDIHVHATAEQDSDYGVDADNRPRIFLDGTRATLELGRHETKAGNPPRNGTIIVRDEQGHALLEMSANERKSAEVRFSHSDDGQAKLRGYIEAQKDGLAIYDAGGKKAMLVTTTGEIKTRKTVTTDSSI